MKKIIAANLIIIFYLITNTTNGQSCVQLNQNYFSCGIPTNEFNSMQARSVAYGTQVQSNWCWAACVQMVLNYHGLYVTQMDVVTKIYGSPYANQAANEQQILTALSGWAPNNSGGYSAIHAYGGYTSIQEIVNGLSGKWPLIVGMSNPDGGIGHAYVLTAIYFSYQYDYQGNVTGYIPDRVVLRDPWPTSPSRQEFSWVEFQSRCIMAAKIWVTTN